MKAAAEALFGSVAWSAAIAGAADATIYPVVDFATGKMGGNIRPYNE